MTITGIHHIALHVADLEGAIAFYERRVGLTRLPRPTMPVNGAWFDLGLSQLHLIEGRIGPVQSAVRGCHFAVEVESVEPYVLAFGERDVEIIKVVKRTGGERQLFFRDSEGYVVELYEA